MTAVAAGTDVDIGALICDTAHTKDWKVSGKKISRSKDGYARISGANTVAGFSARKLGAEAVKLRFRSTLDSKGGWVAFMLRSDGPTQALWTAECTYGLLLRSSQVELQRWRAGTCTTLALASLSIPEDESFTLRFSARNENGAVVLKAVINNEDIIYVTDTVDPIMESGYFSIMTSDNNDIDIYSDSNQSGTNTAVPLVYFTGCYEERGKRFIHWCYNGAYKAFSGIAVSGEDGSALAELVYPADRYELPATYTTGKIFITPLTVNGIQRERIEISTTPRQPKEATGGRIAVQSADDGAYFYDTETGEPFIPRGANYIRLRNGEHSTFEAASSIGPADYDPYDAEAALQTMADNGMNTVRVFIVGRSTYVSGIAGDVDTPGLYAPYMDNLADFITRAKRYGIYVLLTFGCELPGNNHYSSALWELPPGPNTLYLTEQGIKAYSTYLCDVLNDLKDKDPALLSGLLGVQLQNEVALTAGDWPFDDANTSTKVTGTDGRIYDMSLDTDRQELADNSMRHYLNTMTDEIRKVDPSLLVSESVFSFYSVGTTPERSFGMHAAIQQDTRLPPTAEVLLGTKLDFLDIHFYGDRDLNPGETFKAQYDSLLLNKLSPEAQAFRSRVPIIMGEFGSFKNIDNNNKKALDTMCGLRAAALDAGLRGMLYWTLDCFEQENLNNLCQSPEMLSELAKFDIPLEKVEIIALSTATVPDATSVPTEISTAAPTAAPTNELTTDAVSPAKNNGIIPPWMLPAIVGGLIAGTVVVSIAVSKRRKKQIRM